MDLGDRLLGLFEVGDDGFDPAGVGDQGDEAGEGDSCLTVVGGGDVGPGGLKLGEDVRELSGFRRISFEAVESREKILGAVKVAFVQAGADLIAKLVDDLGFEIGDCGVVGIGGMGGDDLLGGEMKLAAVLSAVSGSDRGGGLGAAIADVLAQELDTRDVGGCGGEKLGAGVEATLIHLATRISDKLPATLLLSLKVAHGIGGGGAKGDDIRQASRELEGLFTIGKSFAEAGGFEMFVAAFDEAFCEVGDEALSSAVAREVVLVDELKRFIQPTVGEGDLGLSQTQDQHDVFSPAMGGTGL